MIGIKKLFYVTTMTSVVFAVAYDWYTTYDYVHVEIDKGILRGFKTTSWRETEYYSFKGIPYAKPPVGELRFKAPKEETPWTGVRDAVSHGSVCPHKGMLFHYLRGSEDCLFLNVYTPKLGDEKLPVMVWIHGGAFILGSGNGNEYGPDYFMDAGVVLVTINYRLGALGFLSTDDDAAPGNAGMKDQVAALKWVRRNIAKFGGDPDNVTIFGESAGGASVHFHLLSPMSTGLFAKAIAQSGSALNTWTLSQNAPQVTIRLAEALGAENLAGSTTKAVEFLRTIPCEDLVKAQGRTLLTEEEARASKLLFVPTVESNVKSEEVFLPDYPANILESGNFNKVPFITGYNSHEGYLTLISMMKPKDEDEGISAVARAVPNDIKNEELRNDLAKSISKFYFDDQPIGNENKSNLFNLYTDISFTAGINRATKLQLNFTKAPIFYYVFSYDGGLNYVKYMARIDLPGACHGDELGYLFYQNFLFWKKPNIGSEDEQVINTITRLWSNFAKYGDPTPPGDPLTWKPRTLEEFNCLNISGRSTKLEVNPDPERTKFWEDAYERDAALRHRR